MKIRYVLYTVLLVFALLPVRGQADSVAVRLERIKAATGDSLRLAYADEMVALLDSLPFGGYSALQPVKYLGYKKCSNAEAELFSWAVPLGEGEAFYNLFRFREGGKRYLIKSLPGGKGESSAWLYYDCLAFRSGGEAFFVLLGWNKTRNTNRKIVRIASFGGDGQVAFNHPLLRRGESRSASLMFEYAPDGSMMLKHDKKGKRIIFDHLAPADKKYEGYFMFYGPDASYDALVLKGGEWWYEENIKKVKSEK